jgi:hypothetical protein
MPITLTGQQSLAMLYVRLHRLREDLDEAEPDSLEQLCGEFNRALDDLRGGVDLDLSAFKLDSEVEYVEDRSGRLHARIGALLDYMDLLSGLP